MAEESNRVVPGDELHRHILHGSLDGVRHTQRNILEDLVGRVAMGGHKVVWQ